MNELVAWLGMIFGGIAAVTGCIALWYLYMDRRRAKRQVHGAWLVVSNKKSVTADGVSYPIAMVTNQGGASANIGMLGLAGVTQACLLREREFQPKHFLAPGESFSLAMPPDAPPQTWFLFFYTDTFDTSLAHVTWGPVFEVFGDTKSLGRWARFKRGLTPARKRKVYPVGPDAYARSSILVRGEKEEQIKVAVSRFHKEEQKVIF